MLGCAHVSRPPGRGSELGAALLPTGRRRSSPSAGPASFRTGFTLARREKPQEPARFSPRPPRARKGPGSLLQRRPCGAGAAKSRGAGTSAPSSTQHPVDCARESAEAPAAPARGLTCFVAFVSLRDPVFITSRGRSRAGGDFRLNFWKRCGPWPCVTSLPTRLPRRVGKSAQLLQRKEPVPGNPLFIQ